ncbi:au-specific rna-binding enoyl-CoA hydratase [Neoconidiobolus thromboides FSU 785]|nr:au-specific rna-binding enoyl-CoA hydratase [Neoconidiobolus thromboides FSU 785]
MLRTNFIKCLNPLLNQPSTYKFLSKSYNKPFLILSQKLSTDQASNASTEKLCYLERLENDDQGIAILTMDRPSAKNAISREFLNQFSKAIETTRFDSSIRVLIIRSKVERVFCAGADLKERATMNPQEVVQFLHQLRASFTSLESLPQPTIASIDGAALGGGLELALCCDLRVSGSSSKLGLPETKLAIIPGAGGTQRLSRLIGLSKAKELIFTAKVLEPEAALQLGLVNKVSQQASGLDEAIKLARDILPQGPVAIRMAKQALNRGIQLDKESGLDVEQLCYAQVIPTQDRLEGLKAFKEKRKPVYKGY